MATIIIKNSTGSGVVPSSLVQGELAINTKDGKLYYGSGSGNVVKEFTGSGGGGASFPYTGSAIISGSLRVTGSFYVSNSIDSNNRYLIDSNGISSVRWDSHQLYNLNNNLVIDWDNALFNDAGGNNSIDASVRKLSDSISNVTSIDWDNRILYDGSGDTVSVDWWTRILANSSGATIIDWENKVLYDAAGGSSIDWQSRRLYTDGGQLAFRYSNDYIAQSSLYYQQTIVSASQELLSNTNIDYSGHAIEATVSGIASPGDLIYLETDGTWYVVDQTTTSSTKLLGINIDGANVLLEGDITLNNVTLPDHGLPLYIREANGRLLTSVTPSSGYVRIIGHCYYQNGTTSTNWIVKFKPANDWYKI